jgi:hypothetical protein
MSPTGGAEARANPLQTMFERLMTTPGATQRRKHRAPTKKAKKVEKPQVVRADRPLAARLAEPEAARVELPPTTRPEEPQAVRAEVPKSTPAVKPKVARIEEPQKAPVEETQLAPSAATPIPRPRPDRVALAVDIDARVPLPRANPRPPATENSRRRAPETVASIARHPTAAESTVTPGMVGVGCEIPLAEVGVDAKPVAPFYKGACGISRPVSVSSFDEGKIKLTAKATVTCELAETIAKWLRDTVQPAATSSLGGSLTKLRVVGSYECRSRDHVAGARISEHAFGNAIDLAGFEVNGRWIEVGGSHPEAEQAFLDAIRRDACGPFKTVLGPGSDGYHADHFHLDSAKRRAAGPSRGLFCK